jgi:hypothetical protein
MRTICDEPRAFSWKHDRRRSIEAYRQLADEVWLETAAACPDLQLTSDYGLGFRDGFVDYVYAGGSGEPPPVPPREFWNVMLRAPDGKARANQWFAGYRHGARVAREGGYRDLGTVDSSLVAMHPAIRAPMPMGPPAYPTVNERTWSNEEVLPEPFSPPALEAPQMPLNKNSGNNGAATNESRAVESSSIDTNAFPDDPVENTAPADAPMSTEESATMDRAGNQSTGETSVSPTIAIIEDAAEESDIPVDVAGSPKLTINYLRGQTTAEAHQAEIDRISRSRRERKPAQHTTIRIHGDDDGSKTAPATTFIPYGVTFVR